MTQQDPLSVKVRKYEAWAEAAHWLRVSILQVRRFTAAFQDFAEEPSDTTMVVADGHFLLNASGQAEKALRRAGHPALDGRHKTIRSLREVHEHWEQHKRAFEHARNPRNPVRTVVRSRTSRLPSLGIQDGYDRTWISALRVEDLWDELLRLHQHVHDEMRAAAGSAGMPEPPPPRKEGHFPLRESKALGMAFVTQNIVLSFDEP